MRRNTSVVVLLIAGVIIGGLVWTGLRLRAHRQTRNHSSQIVTNGDVNEWEQAVAKVKEDRGEGEKTALEIPSELRHYADPHWFLATQVAEVRRHNVATCQDFLALAAKIKNGEIVEVPAVTDTYVLFGVGEHADDSVFTKYADDQDIGLYNEAQLHDEYTRIDATRARLASELDSSKRQVAGLKRGDRSKRAELQKQVASSEQELKSIDEHKTLLDRSYGYGAGREELFHDYESLRELASNFRGRSYDINQATDRQQLRIAMLSSLRPEALKVLEEIAAAYHSQFDRPLPVSSLVRPEQYQHALHKVNRNAIMIETPPHSSGLAFDINYRYMSAPEQNFVMAELARLKTAGRIEVLREGAANFHVFAFLDGTRPGDDLIAASLEAATVKVNETHHAVKKPAAANRKSHKAKQSKAKSTRPSRSKSKPKRRR